MGTSPLVRESDLERYLVRQVRARLGLCYKWSSPGRAGVPDRIIVLHGIIGFIELKAPGKKPTALQARELARLIARGAYATWADSREAVDHFLSALELAALEAA